VRGEAVSDLDLQVWKGRGNQIRASLCMQGTRRWADLWFTLHARIEAVGVSELRDLLGWRVINSAQLWEKGGGVKTHEERTQRHRRRTADEFHGTGSMQRVSKKKMA
jgi:hypothetical protein